VDIKLDEDSSVKNLHKFTVIIPDGKAFLLKQAKDLFRWGTGAIMTGCSS